MALISELDDRTLVEQHHAGDPDAFRRIVERYHRSLHSHALRRMRNEAQAEDAVQETFLRAFRALDRFEGDFHLDAWLHRILTHVCADMGRRHGRDLRLVDKVSGEVEPAAPAADDELELVGIAEIDDALASLPDPYREAVVLRFMDELSYSDVASRAGITEENARARVSRGRSMLRSMLRSVSACVVWVIPPLRRNQLDSSADAITSAQHAASAAPAVTQATTAATQAAPAVAQASTAAAQASPLVSQATGLIAQAAPAITSAAPAASSVGKAVVAVGIAASVAIPAGVAVEQRISEPAPAVEEVADDVPVTVVDEPVDVEAAPESSAGSVAAAPTTSEPVDEVVVEADEAVADDGVVVADGAEPADETVDESDAGDDAEGTGDAALPPETATVAAPVAELRVDSLTVTPAGPRLEVAGTFSLVGAEVSETGSITGKVLIDEAADPEAPRPFEGTLLLEFADGSTLELRLRGQSVAEERGAVTLHDLDLRFLLAGGAAHQLEESGELTGTLETADDGSGSLTLRLPELVSDSDGSGASEASEASDAPEASTTTQPQE